MFSGIVEDAAQIVALKSDKGNLHLTLKCTFTDELRIDQSIAHNGVCLTVVSIVDDTYTVTAIKETLDRSNLGLLKVGNKVNVERSMLMNGRLDGHIVQGHERGGDYEIGNPLERHRDGHGLAADGVGEYLGDEHPADGTPREHEACGVDHDGHGGEICAERHHIGQRNAEGTDSHADRTPYQQRLTA